MRSQGYLSEGPWHGEEMVWQWGSDSVLCIKAKISQPGQLSRKGSSTPSRQAVPKKSGFSLASGYQERSQASQEEATVPLTTVMLHLRPLTQLGC